MNCPTCGCGLRLGFVDGLERWACLECGYVAPLATPVPPEPRRRKRLPAEVRSEVLVEREFDKCAEAAGWLVLKTSLRRKAVKCQRCGMVQWPQGGDGCTKGLPDRFVRRPEWPPYKWLGVELKGSKTPLSQEQKELQKQAAILVVRSWAEFLEKVPRTTDG